MANIIIYQHDSDVITYFVENCIIKAKKNYFGTNMKVTGIKPLHWSTKWTDDTTNPVFDEHGTRIGWDKTVSEMGEAAPEPVVDYVTVAESKEAVTIRYDIAGLTYQEIEDYIEDNIHGLADVKTYLKMLSKVVRAAIKLSDKNEQADPIV